MRKYIVVFKVNEEKICYWHGYAHDTEDAYERCMFIPYCYGVNYDDYEVFLCLE